jgi:tetratricopeptide (TPR) repeat protein
MRRSTILILSAAILAAGAAPAAAQSDAQAAYQQAKTAYQAAHFPEARDLAKTAAETDPKNAEVFLLLGKAHYQLGELDEALAAWKQTLELAPQEPYATKMLEVLQARRADVQTRIKLVEVLVAEELFGAASQQCHTLLADKALSDAQRAAVLTLQAEAAVRTNHLTDAQKILREVLTLYPKQADPVQTALLLGQAKLHAAGESTAEGLALLKQVVADHAGTPAAATAQLELLRYDLNQGANEARVAALAKWVADNPKHARAREARERLVAAYLALDGLAPPAGPDTPLRPAFIAALGVADDLIRGNAWADKVTGVGAMDDGSWGDVRVTGVVHELRNCLVSYYAGHQAFAAAASVTDHLATLPLPREPRLAVLRDGAAFHEALALAKLRKEARAGHLSAADPAAMPKELADAAAAYTLRQQEDPANGEPWNNRENLAEQVQTLAGNVPWPERVVALRAPDAWALAIALPVLKQETAATARTEVYTPYQPQDTVPAARTAAISLYQRIAGQYQALGRPEAWQLALGVWRQLVAALPAGTPQWSEALNQHAAALDAYAKYVFAENVKAGRAADNAKLSDVQKELLGDLAKLVAQSADQAPAALSRLADHLKPWIDAGHWSVAEEAYTALADALPAANRRDADLAVARLWAQQVFQRDQRLSAVGLTVPRELDPTLKKALLRCYELQAGLEPNSPKLPQVRGVWDSIVTHYKRLDYEDVAEAAIRTRPEKEKAVDAADQYAEFQLIRLEEERARRELARLLQQYGAAEKIQLTPGLKAVVAAWTKWIAERPTSPLAAQAVEQVLGIGRLFEQHGAPDVAAGIYADFSKFAAGVKVLAQSAPGQPSTAQRVAFLAASALDSQAAKVLAKATADRKPDEPPPAKLSDQYAVTIAAYKAFLAGQPESGLAGDALRRIMAAAAAYADIDAWEVAEGIYADLEQSKLAIRRPERLEFARGVCQLGRAMPTHAREILRALSSAGLGGEGEKAEGTETALAVTEAVPPRSTAQPPAPPSAPGFAFSTPTNAPAAFGAAVQPGQAAGAAGTLTLNGGGLTVNGRISGASAPSGSTAGNEDPFAQPPPQSDQAKQDTQLLAMIQQQESSRSARVAELQDRTRYVAQQPAAQGQGRGWQAVRAGGPPLSAAELSRLDKAIDAAYAIFQDIRKKYADSPTAAEARGEALVMVGYWRSLAEWQRSAALATRFLADNPLDPQLPQLRLEVARDRLAWAAKPITPARPRQEMLAEVTARFAAARADLAGIVADFAKQRGVQQEAQWELANSFLTEARTISAVSPTLARGQFVRAARELRAVAVRHPTHPQIASIAPMLWNISQEMAGQGYEEEAVLVWNELAILDPLNPLAQQAIGRIAETYGKDLKRPLKAAETYLELNFIRGGADPVTQEAVFQIGSSLKGEKRWVEALHVLETFVDSFPRHPQAGGALTMIGQIHQTNEAWQDAIDAYRRVIDEYKDSQWVQDAKWSIAECTINLSRWREAMAAYRDYAAAFPGDAKVAEANRRIEILKDLARYQELVDEKGQRKAFDAQFQIATILRTQLANPVKAIIEYRKVVTNWPESYVAAGALYEIGTAYLGLGETAKAREALQSVAKDYPTSPLAGAALFMVGKSYEDEADRLATVTRATSVEVAKGVAQHKAYEQVQVMRQNQEMAGNARVQGLKSAGKGKEAELEEANVTSNTLNYSFSNAQVFGQQAQAEIEMLTTAQLADRQDKINAALRKAIDAYRAASKIAGGNKADAALLQMANIYDQRLKDSKAAMETWTEIVRQFSGTAVAEDASWKLAQYYEHEGKYAQAIEAYNSFLRNYRRSPNAGPAQFAVAECYEHLGQWVAAMDSYNNYLNNFADGPLAGKAKEQINWIKTYRL